MRGLTLGIATLTAAVVTATATGGDASASTNTVVPAADRPVTFVVDGTTTYGTVHVPTHHAGQRLPAALLLPGSGPTDRNGDQPPSFTPHTLAQIADLLGARGVMSLRFDKYGTGQTGLGAFAGHLRDYDYPAQVRQAQAAYAVLGDQPEARRSALLVLGHSEGALTALMVAVGSGPPPAGVALLQPLDIRSLDIVALQIGERLDAAVTAGQLPADVATANKAGISRVIQQFRAGQPVDFTGLLPAVVNLLNLFVNPTIARYTRSIDAIVPGSVAARLRRHTRVLVTCGTADPQVPCTTTAALVAGLHHARTTGPGLVQLSNVDHELHLAGTPGTDLAPAAVAALTAFVRCAR